MREQLLLVNFTFRSRILLIAIQLVLERQSSRKSPPACGIGKGVLAMSTRAVAVGHVQTLFRGENVAVACIFCNYKEQSTQTIEQLIASILKQIIQDQSTVSESIKAFYDDYRYIRPRHPRLADLMEALRSEIGTYSKVFLVIDALDECLEDIQGSLITRLESLATTIYLMITARPLDLIKDQFEGACHLDIYANDGDVRKYVEGRIRGNTKNELRLAQLVKRNDSLQDIIMDKIVMNVRGMSVLLTSVSQLSYP
jgi:hypothetical protein